MDTGYLSVILYAFVIAISTIGGWMVLRQIKNDNLSEKQLDKVVDVLKWTIGSVVMVAVAATVLDGFKERAQDLSELTYFDKYVSLVTDQNQIEQQYLLCEYLAEVAPSGDMRKSWKRYKDKIQAKYDTIQALNKASKKYDTQLLLGDTLNSVEQKKYDSLTIEKRLINEQSVMLPTFSQLKVDVFWVENKNKELTMESRRKALQVAELLKYHFPQYNIEIREISIVINDKKEYKIQQNQIRYEFAKLSIAKELQQIINSSGLLPLEKIILERVPSNTPNYISVFIRNM